MFGDCTIAESFVHAYLAQKGFRVSENREFFNAPVNHVVRAIRLAPGAIDNELDEIGLDEEDDPLDYNDDDEEGSYVWSSIFKEAQNYYYGHGDYLQDYEEALRLYQQAARLGSLPAYGQIGRMYEQGEGVLEDQGKAIAIYKQGAAKGSVFCYWAMGVLFLNQGHKENAEKCLSNFLIEFPPFTDEQHLTSSERTDIFRECGSLVYRKLKYGIEYPTFLDTFFAGEWAVSIVHHASETEKWARKNNRLDYATDYSKVIQHLNSLQSLVGE
jgi:tetratricopeptide (TPR) repeat protein